MSGRARKQEGWTPMGKGAVNKRVTTTTATAILKLLTRRLVLLSSLFLLFLFILTFPSHIPSVKLIFTFLPQEFSASAVEYRSIVRSILYSNFLSYEKDFPVEKSFLVSSSELLFNSSEEIREKTLKGQPTWTLTPASPSPSVSSRRRTGVTLFLRLLLPPRE